MAACQAVLNTAELLENILLNLEWQHVIAVQRVCRKWRAVCQTSHLITRALLFKSDTRSRITWRIRNPLEQQAIIKHGPEQAEWSALRTTAMLNPVACSLLNMPSKKRFETAENGFLYRIVRYKIGGEESAMQRREASWRAMQLTSPPSVHVSIVCSRKHDIWKSRGRKKKLVERDEKIVRVESKDGVTVGDLAYALCEHWYECRACPISLVTSSGAVQVMSTKATGYECLARMRKLGE